MKNLICVMCGKAVYKNNLCRMHFFSRQKLLDISGFPLVVCRNCGSYYDGKWNKTDSMEQSIIGIVKRKIGKVKTEIGLKKIGNRLRLKITATGADKMKREEKTVDVLLSKKLCDNCIKLSGGYYESMLQLRGENSETLLEMVKTGIDNRSVVSVVKVRNGYDIKLLKKDAARKLVRVLEGCEIKRSYKHVTTKKGRMIYRDFYSIRCGAENER